MTTIKATTTTLTTTTTTVTNNTTRTTSTALTANTTQKSTNVTTMTKLKIRTANIVKSCHNINIPRLRGAIDTSIIDQNIATLQNDIKTSYNLTVNEDKRFRKKKVE